MTRKATASSVCATCGTSLSMSAVLRPIVLRDLGDLMSPEVDSALTTPTSLPRKLTRSPNLTPDPSPNQPHPCCRRGLILTRWDGSSAQFNRRKRKKNTQAMKMSAIQTQTARLENRSTATLRSTMVTAGQDRDPPVTIQRCPLSADLQQRRRLPQLLATQKARLTRWHPSFQVCLAPETAARVAWCAAMLLPPLRSRDEGRRRLPRLQTRLRTWTSKRKRRRWSSISGGGGGRPTLETCPPQQLSGGSPFLALLLLSLTLSSIRGSPFCASHHYICLFKDLFHIRTHPHTLLFTCTDNFRRTALILDDLYYDHVHISLVSTPSLWSRRGIDHWRGSLCHIDVHKWRMSPPAAHFLHLRPLAFSFNFYLSSLCPNRRRLQSKWY